MSGTGIPKFAGDGDLRKVLEYINSANSGVIEVHTTPPRSILRSRHNELAPMQIYIEYTKAWAAWVDSMGGLFEETGDSITETGMYYFLPNKDRNKYRIKRL